MDIEVLKKKGWEVGKLYEVLNYRKTGVEKYTGKKKYFDTGSIEKPNLINTFEGEYEYNNRPSRANRLVEDNDLLQARMQFSNKAVIINETNEKQLFSTGFLHFRPKSNDLIYPKYGYYFLQSPQFLETRDKRATGTTQIAINDQSAKDILIPYPKDLNIQKQIAEKIDTLFSHLDEGEQILRDIQKQLEVYKQSVLKKAFEGMNFIACTLSELLLDIRYGTSKKCEYKKGNIPVIRIPNIINSYIDFSDLKYADFNAKELQSLILKKGDILIIRSNGSLNLVGRSAIVRSTNTAYLFAGYLIRIRVNVTIIDPEFLNLQLKSPRLRKQIEKLGKSTSGVNNINSEQLKKLIICYPTSLEKQNLIIQKVQNELSQINALEKYLDTSLKSLVDVKASILNKAFKGELI